jgi:hypothetical protein
VIYIPHFGKIFLAELKVRRDQAQSPKEYDSYTFHLTMIRMELGCAVSGSGSGGSVTNNGSGSKG